MAALYAQESSSSPIGAGVSDKPREQLIRALQPGPELRADGDGGMPTLFGHFAVFNRWAEIDSWFEDHFLERIAPGAFKKTFRENRDKIRALFQHGRDPQAGDKPLGPITELREEDEGPYYEVPLLDTSYNRELVPGLEAGLYGASFRFEVMREERVEKPEASDDNPNALPERTLKEVRLFEFGPVTFPAYAEATAGVRSLTDHFLFEQIASNPDRARELIRLAALVPAGDDAPATPDAGSSTSGQARREQGRDHLRDQKEEPAWRL